jgi:hypothetical protein
MRRTTLTLIVLAALAGLALAAVSSASIQPRGLGKTPSHCPCNSGLPGGPEGTGALVTSSQRVADDQLAAVGKVTVRITGANEGQKGDRVTNGGVAGTGRFTASGAIADKGTVVVYRTVKGPLITLRFVTVGKKGTITFVVKIDTNVGTSRWTIISGTKAYKGLHGEGIERENAPFFTVQTLTGIVSR